MRRWQIIAITALVAVLVVAIFVLSRPSAHFDFLDGARLMSRPESPKTHRRMYFKEANFPEFLEVVNKELSDKGFVQKFKSDSSAVWSKENTVITIGIAEAPKASDPAVKIDKSSEGHPGVAIDIAEYKTFWGKVRAFLHI